MTIKILTGIFATIFLLSCHSKDNAKSDTPEVITEDTVYDASNSPGDSTLYVKNQSLLWHVDDSNEFKLIKPKTEGINEMSGANVIQLLNNNFDSVHIDYIKTSHDTIYVHIANSAALTERMGSTGAEGFMAAATFSLTELKGIRFVNFDFVEGDHASPGVYSRDNFRNFH